MRDVKVTRKIWILIDRSGSMESIRADTEGGLKSFLAEQAEVEPDTRVSLYQFDTKHDTVYKGVPIGSVPSYVLQPRGGTALLDAIARVLGDIRVDREQTPQDQRPDQNLLLIVTDGEENSSVEYDLRNDGYTRVFKLVETEQGRGLVVSYLGANQDAIKVAAKMGIPQANSITYDASQEGTMSSWAAASASYTRGAKGPTCDMAFTDAEREAAQPDA